MKDMKHTNVSGLKAGLSRYLAAAKAGEIVEVRDRTTPIARLVPPQGGDDLDVVEPTATAEDLKRIRPVRLRRRIDVVRILRESRDQR